ncbi:hypothetical protein P0Y31_12160 [Knoellia sp. 3-2P3]|uniref:hypothetical protein n=1 Tax=unclassified Knoellia TaxID=2618719 RepID=UPI0023DCCEF9|nr:hypothetical protein [Knoellia sp. 3-2P3]MDF2093098.1 hypothetical protein [Knoellia sp. 3-2P3]
MAITGLDFSHAAVLLSLTCSLVGTVLVYRLLLDTAGRAAARATVLLLCTSMAAATFQIAYTEGLALMLLSGLLLQLRRRRYLTTAALMLLLGLTRPVVLPLVIVVAAHAVGLYRSREADLRLRPLIFVALTAVAATAAWPLTAAVITGRPAAFTETQKAWRNGADVGPFGVFSVAHDLGSWGAVALCLAAAGILAAVVLRPSTSVWGPELRAWALAYPMYLFAVAPAAISLFRFFLLAFPLAWIFPTTHGRSTRLRHLAIVTCALAGLLAQWYWIRHFLVLGPVDEQFAMP